MDPLTSLAASGLRSRLDSLEMLSNNLANTNTTGFKADREYLNTYLSTEAMEGSTTGLGRPQGLSPNADSHWTDFGQGTIQPTGNPLDLALAGRGFLVTKGPDGPLYTRNGNLRLDTGGTLRTPEGYQVLGMDGNPLKADPKLPLEITKDGSVSQGNSQIGRIQIVDIASEGLSKRGATYFQWVGPQPPASTPSRADLLQGHLEGSNASPVESSVRLVNILRQFETLNRAVQLGSEMNRRAIEEVARVNQ